MSGNNGQLTARETEVILLIFEGKSSKEVADVLYLSKRTVDFHLANIYEKLEVNSRVLAIRQARALGIINFGLSHKEPAA